MKNKDFSFSSNFSTESLNASLFLFLECRRAQKEQDLHANITKTEFWKLNELEPRASSNEAHVKHVLWMCV